MKYNVNLKFVSIRKCTTFSGKEYQPLYRERPFISEQSCKQAQTEIFRPWGAEKHQLHVWKVIVVNRIRFYTLYINIQRTDIFKFAICRGPHWARFLSGRCDGRGQETIWYSLRINSWRSWHPVDGTFKLVRKPSLCYPLLPTPAVEMTWSK